VTFLSAAVLCLSSTKRQRLKMHLIATLCVLETQMQSRAAEFNKIETIDNQKASLQNGKY